MNRPADDAVATILEIENFTGRFMEAAKSGEVILVRTVRYSFVA